jgi:hypothetical protein
MHNVLVNRYAQGAKNPPVVVPKALDAMIVARRGRVKSAGRY